MCANYDPTSNKINGLAIGPAAGSEGERSIYVGLSTPMDGATDGWDSTRLKDEQTQDNQSPFIPLGSERRPSNASSIGVKREREEARPVNGEAKPVANGVPSEDKEVKWPRLDNGFELNGAPGDPPKDQEASHDIKHREEAMRVAHGNKVEAEAATAGEKAEGSEEGEVEE